jgi:3-mercaptopyruvate sulfurtransferase SseA
LTFGVRRWWESLEDDSSTRVVHQLRDQGYESVFVLRGGFDAWLRKDGLLDSIGTPAIAP